mgnify:CR=1 FL=1
MINDDICIDSFLQIKIKYVYMFEKKVDKNEHRHQTSISNANVIFVLSLMAHIATSATPKENKENITLIWFEPKIGKYADTKRTQDKLRQINDYIIFYEDLQLCITYIQSAKDEKIFLITSGKQASEILPKVSHLQQVDSIFIFCMKIKRYEQLTNKYTKIIGIFNDLDQLCESIREQIHLVDQQIQTLNFFNQHEHSTKDLSKQSGQFIWFQLFKYVILRLPRDEKAKQEMIVTCRNYYRGNNNELKLIDHFEQQYRSQDAIRWYSEQSFVYKLVNKALRIGDYDQLHRFRYFIGDLSDGLMRQHESMLSSDEQILIVYRGAKLNREEFEQLKQNEKKLISTNGYLSTSRDRSLALAFTEKSSKRSDVVPVLFQIQCHVKQIGQTVIFADIEQLSAFPHEHEVLFDVDTAFRIDSIETDEHRQIINMTATNEAENIGKHFIEQTQREAGEQSIAIVFGRLMCNLGQYDKAQSYFQKMLNQSNGEDLAWILFNIGLTLYFKGEWDEARQYYDRAYERMITSEPLRIKDSAIILNNIGNVLHSQGKYTEALEFHRHALGIREQLYSYAHVHTAQSLNNIGRALTRQEKYNEALGYYQRALEIREKLYPYGHVDVATSLNSMGSVLNRQGMYREALDYHQRALAIQEKFFLSTHVHIAYSLNSIGCVLVNLGEYDAAFKYHQRALEIHRIFYPFGHVEIGDSLMHIGSCYEHQKQNEQALDYYRQALIIYEKSLPIGHPTRVHAEKKIHDIYCKVL